MVRIESGRLQPGLISNHVVLMRLGSLCYEVDVLPERSERLNLPQSLLDLEQLVEMLLYQRLVMDVVMEDANAGL